MGKHQEQPTGTAMTDSTDTSETLDKLANARRYCPNCGHANRLTAKICVNCGQAFPPINLGIPSTSSAPVVPNVPAMLESGEVINMETVAPNTVRRAKRCPNCATICKLDAKVCINCGHRFQTDFSQPLSPVSSATAQSTDIESLRNADVVEAPIVQMPSVGVILPPDKPQPLQLPPDLALPSKPALLLPDPPPSTILPIAVDVDQVDIDSTEGEPAPDLTDVDLTALRRRNADQSNQSSGRFTRNGFFKKDDA